MTPSGVRGDILLAAEQLILRQGVQATTTRAIAKAAGCSEGSIYRHFPDKESLVMQVATTSFPILEDAFGRLRDRVGERSVEANLEEAAVQMLDYLRLAMPLLSGILANQSLLTRYRVSAGDRGSGLGRCAGEIADYLAAEQSLGRVPSGVPAARVAKLLVGDLVLHAHTAHLHPDGSERSAPSEEVVRELVATLRPLVAAARGAPASV